MWRHLSQSMALALGDLFKYIFIQLGSYRTCLGIFLLILLYLSVETVNFLLAALTGVVVSQMDCVLQRCFQWKILQDRARYTVYQYTCDMMARLSTIYAGNYVKLLFSIFDLYHS
jgi:hypothetical protein